MPTYTYRCGFCGHTEDRRASFTEQVTIYCPIPAHQGTPMRKVIGAPAVSFKGTGWGGNHPDSSFE